MPPLDGMFGSDGDLRSGVFVYRTIADCLRMRAHARPGDGAVVIGGGLLGLEAAKVLADRGLHVTVVQVAATLMNAQLDPLGGEMLARQIEHHGIFVRTSKTVEGLYGDESNERVSGVFLDDGTTLPADMVVLACGVRPRVEVAKASGLPVNKGIVVNDALATEVPGRLRLRRVRGARRAYLRHRRAGVGAGHRPRRGPPAGKPKPARGTAGQLYGTSASKSRESMSRPWGASSRSSTAIRWSRSSRSGGTRIESSSSATGVSSVRDARGEHGSYGHARPDVRSPATRCRSTWT